MEGKTPKEVYDWWVETLKMTPTESYSTDRYDIAYALLYAEQRIAELEKELQQAGNSALIAGLKAENQRLREAAQEMVDSCDIEFTEFLKGDGTYSHDRQYIVFKPEALENLKAALEEE